MQSNKGFYEGVLVPIVGHYKFAGALRMEILGAACGWLVFWCMSASYLAASIIAMGVTIGGFYFCGLVWDDKTYFRKSHRAAWLIGFCATFSAGMDLYLDWYWLGTSAVTMFIAISMMWIGVQHSR